MAKQEDVVLKFDSEPRKVSFSWAVKCFAGRVAAHYKHNRITGLLGRGHYPAPRLVGGESELWRLYSSDVSLATEQVKELIWGGSSEQPRLSEVGGLANRMGFITQPDGLYRYAGPTLESWMDEIAAHGERNAAYRFKERHSGEQIDLLVAAADHYNNWMDGDYTAFVEAVIKNGGCFTSAIEEEMRELDHIKDAKARNWKVQNTTTVSYTHLTLPTKA